jgi:subtilisin family serine protease
MPAKRFASIAILLLPALLSAQSPKKKITRAADLPQFEYKITGKVEDLVKSEEAFKPFAAQVRKNVESILRDYEIEDPATSRSLLGTLAALDLLDGHDAECLKRLDEIRALEEKPAAKIMSGMTTRAILEGRRAASDRTSPQYRQTVYAAVKKALEAMPYEVVQNDVKTARASTEILSESFVVGQIRANFDPVVQKSGALSSDLAHNLPNLRVTLTERLPLRDTLNEALGAYLAAHKQEKKDIWAERNVTLEPGKNYQPVNVAVWDSGVDVANFKNQVLLDTSGKPAVIAYDLQSYKTTGNLYPLTAEQSRRFPDARNALKGLSDLQANIESPESTELRQAIAKLKPDQVKAFLEEVSLFSVYAHGTHVAGILLAGNPYARVLTARLSFDYKVIPDPCPTREQTERDAAAAQDYVNFFKQNQVRVVNMSWGGTVKEMEGALEKCAAGQSPETRKQQAREVYEIYKSALDRAMRSAPEILFVAAAGNANADSSFDEAIPASLRMPNLLTVGAVDKAGDEAAFTSYGPTVAVHANGYEVESYIPGGTRLRMSGTSMASPNVANLAAKLLVLNPKLTPPEVIDRIRKTAEPTADGRRNLINPKKAVSGM